MEEKIEKRLRVTIINQVILIKKNVIQLIQKRKIGRIEVERVVIQLHVR
jgi:hypothetical protein